MVYFVKMSFCLWLLIPFSQVLFSAVILLQSLAFPKQCGWFIFRAVSSLSVFRLFLSDQKVHFVMNTGARFFRFIILLPRAFFLSNLEPPTYLTSKLALPFNTVVRINALCYAKRDVAYVLPLS